MEQKQDNQSLELTKIESNFIQTLTLHLVGGCPDILPKSFALKLENKNKERVNFLVDYAENYRILMREYCKTDEM